MKRQAANLTVAFLVLGLAVSSIAILPSTSQTPKDEIVGKLQQLRSLLEGQKALQNKVNAVIHQVEAEAFNGAVNKLENDVKKSITARVPNSQNLIDLVNEIINLIKGITPPAPLKPDFSITASPSKLTIMRGASAKSNITIVSLGGFNQTVTLTNSTDASGVTLSLNPSSVKPLTNSSANSTLTVTVSSTAAVGEFDITVTGSSAKLQHSVRITLEITSVPAVPDFTLRAFPNTFIIPKGSANTSLVTITSLNGFNEKVNLAITSVAIPDVTFLLNPIEVVPPVNAYAISVLTIDVGNNAQTGTFTVTIAGVSGSLTHSANIALNVTMPPVPEVPDFSIITSPSSLTIEQGNNATATVTVVSLKGFSQQVNLDATSANGGVTLTLSPTQLTPAPDGIATSTLKIAVAVTTAPSQQSIIVSGTSGVLTHTATITLTITAETKPPKIVSIMRIPEEAPSYNQTVAVLASVTDLESGINNVILNYARTSLTSQNATMNLTEGSYRANIPTFPYGAHIEYRIYASDKAGNWAVSNTNGYTVTDPYPPVISVPMWSPIEPAANEEITINITVTEPTDASGVDNVVLSYRNGTLSTWRAVPMIPLAGGNWTAKIANQSGTTVQFVVNATDKAGNKVETATYQINVAGAPAIPLAWILAAIIVIAAIIGGTYYYTRWQQKKGA